jgi:hypothetical protein
MEMLEKLWRLADTEGSRTNTDPLSVFDPIGLILVRPLKNFEYESTPTNSLTFANTGGDGVHYSLIILKNKISTDSPVVMTVPMNYGSENMIVGENLYEFLSLGCQTGYFFLEQLTYKNARAETLQLINNPKQWFKENYINKDKTYISYLLGLLVKEFQLKPWINLEQRFEELQSQFMSSLQFSK